MDQWIEKPGSAGTGAQEAPLPAVAVVDTITKLDARHKGAVVVAASHGGLYAGYCAAKGGVRAVILNDAGIGRDRAGIGSLEFLDGIGMAAATASHLSCRIGDGKDMAESGVVSHVNRSAAALGCRPGQTVRECAALMLAAPMPGGPVPEIREARFVIRDAGGEPRVIGVDSASLLRPDDEGQIVVTASHGALLGGKPDSAVSVPVLAAVFSDAGLGKDEAGATRLPALGDRGIPAVTAAADSARIGDARSVYDEGIVSRVNDPAAALGTKPGDRIADFVERVLARARAAGSIAAGRS